MIEPKLAPKEPFKPGRPVGVVVHTTGVGIVQTAQARGIPPMVRAVRLYRLQQAEGPHAVIDQEGNVETIQLPERVAYHVGTLPHAKLAAPITQAEYAWWRQRFPKRKKLLDHPLWWTGSVNRVALGIEVIPHANPSQPWSTACVDSLSELLRLLRDGGMHLDRDSTVATHSELSPYTRTAKGQPWDLAPHNVAQLDEIVRNLAPST